MAFTTVLTDQGTLGPQGMRMKWGTWENTAGSTGGDIETGLAYVAGMCLTPTSHYNTATPKFTITASDGSVTIVTEPDVDGRWIAFGIGEAT